MPARVALAVAKDLNPSVGLTQIQIKIVIYNFSRYNKFNYFRRELGFMQSDHLPEQELLINQIKEQFELYKINTSLRKGFERTKLNNLILEAVKTKNISLADICNLGNLTADEKNYFLRCFLADFACIGNAAITKQLLALIKETFPETSTEIMNAALCRVVYDGNTFAVFNTIDLLLAAGANPCYKLVDNESIVAHALTEQGRLGPMAIRSLLLATAQAAPNEIITLLKNEQYANDRKMLNFLGANNCDPALRQKIIAIIKNVADLKYILDFLQKTENDYQLVLDARLKINAQTVLLPANYAKQFIEIITGSITNQTTDALFWQAYNQPTIADRKQIFDELLLAAANIKDADLRQQAFMALVLWAGDNHATAKDQQEALNFILLSVTNLPSSDQRKKALGGIILAVSRIVNDTVHERFREIISRYQNNESAKINSTIDQKDLKPNTTATTTSITKLAKTILPPLALTAGIAAVATVVMLTLPIALGITISLIAAGISAFSFIKALGSITPKQPNPAAKPNTNKKIDTPSAEPTAQNKPTEEMKPQAPAQRDLTPSVANASPTNAMPKDHQVFKI